MGKSGVPILLVIWLIVGAVIAGQRGYFSGGEESCASIGSAVITVVAGPLNLLGLSPEIECPDLSEAQQPAQ
ncbi:hypothetical protein F4561_005834 [Lipingzhangella halophila]|uniref:Uncharacterized protein n=1 Tax=Lipingzhangella halophila TaxID=1783352 RepID=A0A7W7RMW3_9ACTN|nr:hypothetical protein [Lipingzhangella halophila]MBB4934940.1 hypothetical protein [Lipingzhangella halophila]